MELKDLLSDSFLHLPKGQLAKGHFKSYVFDLLDEYMAMAKQVTIPDEQGLDPMRKLTFLVTGIRGAIESYYHGKPFDAFQKIRMGIKKSGLQDYWERIEIPERTDLYRIRLVNDNYRLEREKLFHIPFDLRGKVATQRFSIPGFPSLYMSNSIYTAWEELMRPGFDQIQAIRLSNTVPLSVMDLTHSRYSADSQRNRDQQAQVYDFIMWPLIAICSIKVADSADTFKPEYILPQLLLQWVRSNSSVHGIKFSSTHIDLHATGTKGEFFNVVVPVVENKETGYCNVLSRKFKATEVLSWQLMQFSFGEAEFSYNSQELEEVNHDIQEIEMIIGRAFPYRFSPLATIERTLRTLPLKPIVS